MRLLPFLFAALLQTVSAQAPGVPIMRELEGNARELIQAAENVREKGGLLSMPQVAEQMDRRHVAAELPAPRNTPLQGRDLWQISRAAHVRVGWHYLCKRCDHWHQTLAGGFFISDSGLVATCQHVVAPKPEEHREAYLVAAGDDGVFYPVLEILASDEPGDVAILRVAVEKPVPFLPLNVEVYPGDDAWCYSSPLRRAGYFSKGVVNRFHRQRHKDREITRLAVTTDWAPGSSGSAILDSNGNAIGLVSTISPEGARRPRVVQRVDNENETMNVVSDPTMIVFRAAARAADILALTRPPEPVPAPSAPPEEPAQKE